MQSYYQRNRDKKLKYAKEYREKNKEKIKQSQQKCYQNKIEQYKERRKYSGILTRMRTKCIVMDKYGGKCNCCYEPRLEFLTIDHINGGGNKHRKELFGNRKQSGTRFYNWLIKNNFPEGYQVLCWNCNSAKHIYTKCPHKRSMGGA